MFVLRLILKLRQLCVSQIYYISNIVKVKIGTEYRAL